MPISKDQFEEIDEDESGTKPTPGTNPAKVLDFLRANPSEAFTRSEISEATGIPDGSIGPTLVRLREQGRVDHRGHYWRVSDHEESIGAATNHASSVLEAREDDEETPNMDEWQDNAEDPREKRNE